MKKQLINDFERNEDLKSQTNTKSSELLLVWLRAIQLMITTLNLFTNVYIMLSLDRFMISYALLTMISCFVGQLAAIVGQFGYKLGRILALVYALSAVSLILVTVVTGEIGHNLLLNISLAMTAISGLISGYVWFKS